MHPTTDPPPANQGKLEAEERATGAWAIVWIITAAFGLFLGGTVLLYASMVGWINIF